MLCLIAEFLVLEFLRTDSGGPKRVGTGDAELEKKLCPYKVTCSHPYKVWGHVFHFVFTVFPDDIQHFVGLSKSVKSVYLFSLFPSLLPRFLPFPLSLSSYLPSFLLLLLSFFFFVFILPAENDRKIEQN